MTTARVQLWFAEVNNSNPARVEYARRPSGAISLLGVDESAGSVPILPLGSYWQDGTRQPDPCMHQHVKVEHAFVPPQKWRLVKARDCRGLAAGSFPLNGEVKSGQVHQLDDAPILVCETASGNQLLIPSYEIFRRFYGVCSTLANGLLSQPWQRELHELVDREHTGISEDGKHFLLTPQKEISSIGCRAIALFEQCEFAKTQARRIFTALANARRTQFDDPWIEVVPPWLGNAEANTGGMTISFVGHQLDDGSTLVLWIYDSPFPVMPRPLVRVIPEIKIPVYSEEREDGPGGKTEQQEQGDDPANLSPPADTKIAKGLTHLPIADSWSDLSPIHTKYLKKTPVPVSSNQKETKPRRKRRLSTGHASQLGQLNGASLSSDEHNKIKDRFQALSNSFKQLLEERYLSSREDYAQLDSYEINGTHFCELPTKLGVVPSSWAIISTADELRPRLCWVSKLTLSDGGVRYLFDIEAQEGEAFYALVLKLHSPGEELSDLLLEQVLRIAVKHQGRWKNGNWETFQQSATYRLIRHQIVDGMIDLRFIKAGLSDTTPGHKAPPNVGA